jgi:hypothetical protein
MPRRAPIATAVAVLFFLLLTAEDGGVRRDLVVGDFSAAPADSGVPAPWKPFLRAGKADFSLERDEAVAALVMRCRDASFGFQREMSVSVDEYPTLAWKWKAMKLPEGGDFRKAGADDQAAQLYVAFSKTKIIGYIWDSSAPEGSSGDAPSLPPFVSLKVIVLRSGPAQAGRWLEERRNLREDYERLFGPAKGPLVARGLRVQVNSQHGHGDAACAFADIGFGKAGE